MRRWIEWAAALYPARWREEYGEEFDGLLEQLKPNLRTFGNVLWGALAMQVKNGTGWMKAIAVAGASGAVVTCALSFWTMPVAYQSSATIAIRPVADPLRPAPPAWLEERAAVNLATAEGEILSRTTLEGLIRNPALDLYPEERRREPMDQIVERMRRDTHLRLGRSGAAEPIELAVSFDYPDRLKAQAVASELVALFVETNLRVTRTRAQYYQAFWRNQVEQGRAQEPPPAPKGEILDVLSPADPARTTGQQGRLLWIAAGAAAGALLGGLFLRARRRPHGIVLLAGSAAAGMLVAAAIAFLIPNRYTSTGVMRVSPAMITSDPLSTVPASTAEEWLRNFEPGAINRDSLKEAIQKLDLYPKERSRESLDQVAQRMAEKDLRIVPEQSMTVPRSPGIIRVSFSYSDPDKARRTVSQVVGLLTENYVKDLRARQQNKSALTKDINAWKAGENLDVIDPPSLPQSPDRPNRGVISLAGLGLGLLAGSLAIRPRIASRPT